MPISVSCPSCGAKLKAPDAAAGKTIKCPKCFAPMSLTRTVGNGSARPDAPSSARTPRTSKPSPSSAFVASIPQFATKPYVEQNLVPGEQVIYCGEIHWAIFVPGIVLLPLFGIGLILLLSAYIRKRTTELAVTDQRVIIKVGLISRKTLEMNLAKIENIQVDQGILDRIFGYGTITVVGTGGTREPFLCIADPLAFRKAVQAQSHD